MKWFENKNLSFVYGLNVTFTNLAYITNAFMFPQLYNEDHLDNLGWLFAIGFLVCTSSYVMGMGASKSKIH